MSNIKAAAKSERITEVTFKSYDGELKFSEDRHNRGRFSVTATQATNPLAGALDELLSYATPSEDECPPREVTLQSLIDLITQKREALNESWGSNKGQPRLNTLDFTLDTEDLGVLVDVLEGKDVSYETRKTVRAAVSGTTESEW